MNMDKIRNAIIDALSETCSPMDVEVIDESGDSATVLVKIKLDVKIKSVYYYVDSCGAVIEL